MEAAPPRSPPQRLLLVTGLSGAGKTTVLKTLEDMGWESVDNFPLRLVDALLATPAAEGGAAAGAPLAIGFDSRTREFGPQRLIEQIKTLREHEGYAVSTLYLDCSGAELERRFMETRRRHPLALDRPASDGIAQERATMEPVRRWAETVIDSTRLSAQDLAALVRDQFQLAAPPRTAVTVTSFGFSRGVPHNADLVFDLRFLRNPHWVDRLRPMTGLDREVADYIAADTDYDDALDRMRSLILFLLPRYEAGGKAYVNIAFGCTGGRHRSVHVAERFAGWLRDAGFSPTVVHRNLSSRPIDALEGHPGPSDRTVTRAEP